MTALVVNKNEKDLTKFAEAINQLTQGRSNAVGSCTLATGATSTTVTAINCGSGSTVLLFPATANASAEFGNGTIHIKTTDVFNGSFKITHANNANADRTFLYVCLG